MRYVSSKLTILAISLCAPILADSYTSNWNISLGCPMHEATSSSGNMSFGSEGFSGSGTCSRLSSGFGKYNFSTSSGGTLRSTDVYPIQMGKLSFVPPLRTTDTTPVFSVEASCPTSTKDVNWVFVQSTASRTADYFWGRSTMSPSSTTMSQFYDIDGSQLFSGSYSLPVGSCASGVIDVAGSVDFQAKIYSTDEWSGFYKTGPGNVSFFAPPWSITQSYFNGKTYAGLLYSSQDGDSSKLVQVVGSNGGATFTIKPYSNPETATLATGSGSFTDTISISTVNSPLAGMMKGTVSRVDHNSAVVGTTEKVGCLAYETGSGGTVVTCAGKNPADNSTQYAVTFNHKPTAGGLDVLFAPSASSGAAKQNVGLASNDDGRAIALQTDGKIVMGGFTEGWLGYEDFAVTRLNADGTVDTDFSASGTYGAGRQNINFSGNSLDFGEAVAIQSDGKIVIAGYTNAAGNNDFAVVRLNTDGTIDTNFSASGTYGAGKQAINFTGSSDDQAKAVAIQSDGKILVAGYTTASGNSDFAVVRLNTDGTLDTSFSPSGTYGAGKQTINFSGSSNDRAEAIAIQSDGKIILAGTSNNTFAATRLDTDGSPDTSFNSSNGSGKQTVSFGDASAAHAMALQSDGKIVLAGERVDEYTGGDFAVTRLNSDGTLDTSFSASGYYGAGKYVLDFQFTYADFAEAIALQSDGKILVGGRSMANGLDDFAIIRLNPNGTIDSTFNPSGPLGAGKLTTDFASNSIDQVYSMAVSGDGKIFMGGTFKPGSDSDFGITRVFP